MNLILQCAYCGSFVTLAAPQIFAGNLPCPRCTEMGIMVPVSKTTPAMQPLDIEETYVILEVGGEG